MSAWPRTILHLDMDAFYAAVEQRDHPELRGKPILVGGRGKRGVVTTASYEARPFGCRSAMPMGQALRLCPEAIVVPVRMGVYAEESRRVRAIMERFTPDIEPISIDEAFLDLTHVPAWSARPIDAANELRRLIRSELRLTASIGVAPNKFLAKVASDMNKPDGLGVISPENAPATLAPMHVSVIWGIGKVTLAKLHELNIKTVADMLAFDAKEMDRRFGDAAGHWRRLARGEDERALHTTHVNKSIGKERTFGDDIEDPVKLRAILMDELERAARLLREDTLLCRRVSLKLRRPDFTTYSRSSVLPAPTDRTPDLWGAAARLLDEFFERSPGPLRLIGVRLEDLAPPTQPGLFDEQPPERRSSRLDEVSDAISARFGSAAIGRAGSLDSKRMRKSGNAGKSMGDAR